MMLVESLQQHYGVVPSPPQCRNKTGYVSVFTITDEDDTLCAREEDDGQEMDTAAEEEEMLEGTSGAELNSNEITAKNAEMVVEESGSAADKNDATCTISIQQARQKIIELRNTEMRCDERSLQIMQQISTWNHLWGLYDTILSLIPKIPSTLATTWTMKPLVETDQRFREFIPLTIGERTVLSATADGNCIYNSVSTALYGTENMAMTLRLASVIRMVDDILSFAKYIIEEYKDAVGEWVAVASTQTAQVLTVAELELTLREELLATLMFPYKDGTLLHLHLLCHLLGRPIQQHCVKGDLYQNYKILLHPPLYDVVYPSPLHLVWVPAKPSSKYSRISHVVPAVCQPGPYFTNEEECAFVGFSTCALTYGFNAHIKNPYWVECSLCNQWVHTLCLNIEHGKYRNKEFACGCDSLRNNKCPIRSLQIYPNLTLDDLPKEINLKAVAENIPDSLRNSLFRRAGYSRLKWQLRCRLGPFNEEFIGSVNQKLAECVEDTEKHLVPDIYLPEVLYCNQTPGRDGADAAQCFT